MTPALVLSRGPELFVYTSKSSEALGSTRSRCSHQLDVAGTLRRRRPPDMTPCRIPTFYSPDGSRDLVNWVRLALPENGTPSVVAINVVWGIPSPALEYAI
jgi:hypothetical protein